jgi:hypothetical protein
VTDLMRERGAVINSAAQMLSSGDVNLDTMPQLILRIINEGMWRQRAIPQRRWELSREFATFEEFVTADPLDGLKTSIRTLKDLCRRDVRAQEAIDRATQREGGRPPKTLDNIQGFPSGTSQSVALRRLRKDRPDLLQRVLDGELSAHAAAVEAGYRHRTLNIRADDPEHAARTLRKHFTDPGQRVLLAKLLTEQDN